MLGYNNTFFHSLSHSRRCKLVLGIPIKLECTMRQRKRMESDGNYRGDYNLTSREKNPAAADFSHEKGRKCGFEFFHKV